MTSTPVRGLPDTSTDLTKSFPVPFLGAHHSGDPVCATYNERYFTQLLKERDQNWFSFLNHIQIDREDNVAVRISHASDCPRMLVDWISYVFVNPNCQELSPTRG